MIPYYANDFEMKDMVGKTFSSVKKLDNDQIEFSLENGDRYIFHHRQDCCESVEIRDIVGDLSDLEGSPILEAEESTKSGDLADGWGSETWTFYKFGTIKGHVNINWYGESNGYYSEQVDRSFISATARKDD